MKPEEYRYDEYRSLSTEDMIRKLALSYTDKTKWLATLATIRNKRTATR